MDRLDLNEILTGEKVSLMEILEAREKRVELQRKILDRYRLPLISFTLNIPGSYKTFPLGKEAFEEGKKVIKEELGKNKIQMEYSLDNSSKTGYEFLMSVDSDAKYLKELMVEIEDKHPLGRIFDIDVLDSNGDKISRSDIKLEGRKCLLCEDMAHICARSRKHSMEDLIFRVVEIMLPPYI